MNWHIDLQGFPLAPLGNPFLKRSTLVPNAQLDLQAYEAALRAAAFFPLVDPGALLVSGPDRQAFLQRQTTNDLRLLSPQRAVVSVLTSPTARILDVLTLLEENGAILALTLPGRGMETARFLRSRIFFGDKVSLEQRSETLVQIELIGPGSAEIAGRLGLPQLPGIDALSTGEHAGTPTRAIGQRGPGPRLLVPAEQAGRLVTAMLDAGARELDPGTYTVLRIEAGIPAAGHELTEEYTPLEAGLQEAVSDSKGCYTGQEVIARQITYDKVTRHLVGLELQGSVSQGARLWAPEQSSAAGTVTSAAHSPRFGHIALAVVKRPFNQPGSALLCGDPQAGIPAKVRALPFT